MENIDNLEKILQLMQKYRVNAVKVGDIEVCGIQLPLEDDDIKEQPEEVDEDILFYSAGN